MQCLGVLRMNLSGFGTCLANAQCTGPNAQRLPDAQHLPDAQRLPDVQCLCIFTLAEIFWCAMLTLWCATPGKLAAKIGFSSSFAQFPSKSWFWLFTWCFSQWNEWIAWIHFINGCTLIFIHWKPTFIKS